MTAGATVELPFQMHREPVRQRALAEILFEQKGLVRVKFPDRVDDLLELGLHPISLERDDFVISLYFS